MILDRLVFTAGRSVWHLSYDDEWHGYQMAFSALCYYGAGVGYMV